MVAAETKMKALVAARLMMGDITNWTNFENERRMAGQIANRQTARDVSRQIGRGYCELSDEIRGFIDKNLMSCGFGYLARITDEINVGSGISMRLAEFEEKFLPLAEAVKRHVPTYAHIHISTFGLKFEFPEHHFLRDMETSLPELLDTRARLAPYTGPGLNSRRDRDLVGGLVAKEKFLSRSMISATFSLAEAFLGRLFFTAVDSKSGRLHCDEEFMKFAATKKSAPLRDRLDRVVRFTSEGMETGNDEPFKEFIEMGKGYRDAIHHTTPCQRKDVDPGGRLTALYEIDCDLALRCVALSTTTLLKISHRTNPTSTESDIAMRCDKILQMALTISPDFPIQRVMAQA